MPRGWLGLSMIGLAVCAVVGLSARGQEPPGGNGAVYRVGGGLRDGVSAFPRTNYAQLKPIRAGEVDFKHYHTYEEATALLRMWTARYPNLVQLYSVGRSLEGREIWQITITNQRTGKATDKPAFFLEGGRHAGEQAPGQCSPGPRSHARRPPERSADPRRLALG